MFSVEHESIDHIEMLWIIMNHNRGNTVFEVSTYKTWYTFLQFTKIIKTSFYKGGVSFLISYTFDQLIGSTSPHKSFIIFWAEKFLSHMFFNGIFQGVLFYHDKIHCLDQLKCHCYFVTTPNKSQIHNTKLLLCLYSTFDFLALLCLAKDQAKYSF